jgi:ribulose 1,5-bisphosphate carboxylase large subunit-like protein
VRQAPPGYFLADYYLEVSKGTLLDAATKIAVEESTGEWVGEDKPTELFQRSRAEVYKLEELEPGKGMATVAFPISNMCLDKYFMPSFWLFMTGGPLFERLFCDTVRLTDFCLPSELLKHLPGPKFGMQGTRRFIGVPDGELVVGTIVKPCAGLTAEEVADKCGQAAAAGIDFIKDDEKMNNPPYCSLEKKVRLVSEALRAAEGRTGRKVIYCPHMSTRPDNILDAAHRAVDAGATGLMINVFATGFGALQILAEDDSLPVPIYVHTGGRSAWSRVPGFGIDLKVVTRLVRLLGGDFMRAHMVSGYLIADTEERSRELVELMREPIEGIRDMAPALSGGLGAQNIVDNVRAFGPDILPLAGSGILAHPMGIAAGVLAIRQAAQSYREGIPLERYAEDHPELAAALKKSRVAPAAEPIGPPRVVQPGQPTREDFLNRKPKL